MKDKLFYNNYRYIWKSEFVRGSLKTVYWQCTKFPCKAKVVEFPIGTYKERGPAHICGYSDIERQVDAAMDTRLRDLTMNATEDDTPLGIIEKFLEEQPLPLRDAMPDMTRLLDRVRRFAKGTDSKLIQANKNPENWFGEPIGNIKKQSAAKKRSRNKISQLDNQSNKKRRDLGLRLVDESGKNLGLVPVEKILTAGENPVEDTQGDNNDDNEGDDDSSAIDIQFFEDGCGHDDDEDEAETTNTKERKFRVETMTASERVFVLEESIENRTVTTSSSCNNKTSSNTNSMKSRGVNKSGERCFVCGDELIVSETLNSCNEKTFRKACSYLNVRLNSDCSRKGRNATQLNYSLCKTCVTDIEKIHELSENVQELQSLIFKNVEKVERRVAEAEIVDNWMANSPSPIAKQFEGFRNQVLINYTNKLKLRREIRERNKVGHNMIEIRPARSANMLVGDPNENVENRADLDLDTSGKEDSILVQDMFPSTSNSNRDDSTKSGKKLKNLKEKGSHESQIISQDESSANKSNFEDNDNDNDNNFVDFFDDADAMSTTSEPEIKFCSNDGNKLLETKKSKKREVDPDWEPNTESGSGDVDCITSGKESDTESSPLKSKARGKGKTGGSAPKSRARRKADGSAAPKSRAREVPFPDAVLTKDKRIFMSGVEIIKNPVGSLMSHPTSISFSCGSCGKMVQSFWSVRQHICGHHLGFYNCDICGKEIRDPNALSKHKIYAHFSGLALKPTPCPVCGKPVRGDQRNVRFHQWSHLSEEEKKDPQYASYCPSYKKDPNRKIKNNTGNQVFMCSFCSKTYKKPHALQKHEEVHRKGGRKFQCQYCGRVYDKQSSHHEHSRRCAEREAKARGDPTWTFPCSKCPARLNSRSSRERHMLVIHKAGMDPSLPLACPKCPRRFSRKSSLNFHKKVCVEGQKSIIPNNGHISQPSKKSKKQAQLPATEVEVEQNSVASSSISQPVAAQSSSDGGGYGSNPTGEGTAPQHFFNLFGGNI